MVLTVADEAFWSKSWLSSYFVFYFRNDVVYLSAVGLVAMFYFWVVYFI